jgi:hypothetical protein
MRAIVGVGAESLDDFAAFGDVADNADIAIGITAAGARDLREGVEVDVYYLDDAEGVLVECMERIKTAWEQAKPDKAALGHQAAGFWVFYWLGAEMKSIRRLVLESRASELRAAAADYIDSGFGELRGPAIPELAQA